MLGMTTLYKLIALNIVIHLRVMLFTLAALFECEESSFNFHLFHDKETSLAAFFNICMCIKCYQSF